MKVIKIKGTEEERIIIIPDTPVKIGKNLVTRIIKVIKPKIKAKNTIIDGNTAIIFEPKKTNN